MENGSRQDEGGKWKKSSRRQFLRRSGAVAVAVGSLGPSVDAAGEVALALGGEPQAAIVIGRSSGNFYRWVAEELKRYLRLLSGAELAIVMVGESSLRGNWILLGGPESNDLISGAQKKGLVDFSSLKKDGFLIQTIDLDG